MHHVKHLRVHVVWVNSQAVFQRDATYKCVKMLLGFLEIYDPTKSLNIHLSPYHSSEFIATSLVVACEAYNDDQCAKQELGAVFTI